jgi:hypothetical protein
LLSTPKGGVARAALQVIAPAAQTTRAPATVRFNVLRLMICPPTVCVRMETKSLGAQTERRAGYPRTRVVRAGEGLAGRSGLTGRFTSKGILLRIQKSR